MRLFAAIVLAGLLAVGAYAGFWWFSLTYNAAEMKGAVEEALGGSLNYGQPQWVPELTAVRVRWPNASLIFFTGPVREIDADTLVMVSGFLAKDSWTLELPPEVRVKLQSGAQLLVQTKGGKIVLLSDPVRIAFRADELTVLNMAHQVVAHVNDVMAERSPSDEGGVRLNLASRPDWGGGQAVLSGQVVLPADVAGALVAAFGSRGVPRFGDVMRVVVRAMQVTGGTAVLDNVSFKLGEASGAVYGNLKVTENGDYAGSLSVTADSLARLMGWLGQAGVIDKGVAGGRVGWNVLTGNIDRRNPAVRIEAAPAGLLVNGVEMGRVPKVAEVVQRLWP